MADGGCGFKPEKIKKFFSLTGTVKTSAVACLECGAVHLSLDPKELVELSGDE
jgi:hypothetical protein